VRVGDTEEKVRQALGEPLRIRTGVYDGKRLTYWMYTISPTKSDFHERWIIFGEDGRVKERVSEFYLD
jgi:hypothetical protein